MWTRTLKSAVLILVLVATSTGLTTYYLTEYYLPKELALVEADLKAEVPAYRVWTAGSSPVDRPSDFVAAANRVTQSVVNIRTYSNVARMAGGSGVIISEDGFIITNFHVIEDAARIEVTLPDNTELTAKLIGYDPTTDLALLKVKGRSLSPISFGDSDLVEVGEWALAIGNPFNLASTVTAGIVSAKGRNINILRGAYSIESFIQTDAVVNPGNSGGALVNDQGELIGINTAIMSEGGGYEGYSFAIPSNLVAKVITDIKEYGSVQRAILGVNILDVSANTAEELDLPRVSGVLIQGISPGGSAERAGLRPGDVIVGVDGVETQSVPELQEIIARYRPGDRIRLEYYRDGRVLVQDNIRLRGVESVVRE
jgi:serine protease Do